LAIRERIAAARAAEPVGRGAIAVWSSAAMRRVVRPLAAVAESAAITTQRIHLIASALAAITQSTLSAIT